MLHANEMPQMLQYASTSAAYPLGAAGATQNWLNVGTSQFGNVQALQGAPVTLKKKEQVMASSSRRLVQVFIADPNESVPLDQCLLYSGEQKLTDATDQELFFEIDIKGALDKHNEKRVKIVDKTVKERTEYLEPAKVRDLKMVVVTVAQF